MHTWQASIYFYFFTCIFSDAEWNHTHKETKREMPHFLNSIFYEFLILPVLSFSRYSRHARSSSLVFRALSSLSHCSHTCCPSSHNLTPSLEPFVLFPCYPVFLFLYREYQHSVREASFYTAVDSPFHHEKRSVVFPLRMSWTATLRMGWAAEYSNLITRGQNQKDSVYTGALTVCSYCCSIYNNEEPEPDLMPARRQMGDESVVIHSGGKRDLQESGWICKVLS